MNQILDNACIPGWEPYFVNGKLVRPHKPSVSLMMSCGKFNTQFCECWQKFFAKLKKIRSSTNYSKTITEKVDSLNCTIVDSLLGLVKVVSKRSIGDNYEIEQILKHTGDNFEAVIEYLCKKYKINKYPHTVNEHSLIIELDKRVCFRLYCIPLTSRDGIYLKLVKYNARSSQTLEISRQLEKDISLVTFVKLVNALLKVLPYVTQQFIKFDKLLKKVGDYVKITEALYGLHTARIGSSNGLQTKEVSTDLFEIVRTVKRSYIKHAKQFCMEGYGFIDSSELVSILEDLVSKEFYDHWSYEDEEVQSEKLRKATEMEEKYDSQMDFLAMF